MNLFTRFCKENLMQIHLYYIFILLMHFSIFVFIWWLKDEWCGVLYMWFLLLCFTCWILSFEMFLCYMIYMEIHKYIFVNLYSLNCIILMGIFHIYTDANAFFLLADCIKFKVCMNYFLTMKYMSFSFEIHLNKI